MEYKVSAFKVIINGVIAYSWIIRKSRILPGISWAIGDLIGKLNQ